mmetsp:Transcript_21129/g.60588  ORF Transcript_21129/g.60588 Transcript_21129/m.60588 type:complete len:133 (+) Transcript_21129:1189-1587(+)
MLVATATRGSLRRRPHSSRKRHVRRRFCRSSAGVIPSCTTEGSFDSSNALGTLWGNIGGAPPGGGGGLFGGGGAPGGGRGRPPGGAPGGGGRAGCGWDMAVKVSVRQGQAEPIRTCRGRQAAAAQNMNNATR